MNGTAGTLCNGDDRQQQPGYGNWFGWAVYFKINSAVKELQISSVSDMKWNSYQFCCWQTAHVWNCLISRISILPPVIVVARLDRVVWWAGLSCVMSGIKTNPRTYAERVAAKPGFAIYQSRTQRGFISLHFDEPVSGDQWVSVFDSKEKWCGKPLCNWIQKTKGDQACAQPGYNRHIRNENNWSANSQSTVCADHGTVIFTDNGPYLMRGLTLLAWAVLYLQDRVAGGCRRLLILSLYWSCVVVCAVV